MKSRPPHAARPDLTLANLRRRVLPLAATTAAFALTGCAMPGASPAVSAPQSDTDPAAAVTAQRTREQVKAFTAGLDEAIAKLDRDKLRPADKTPGADPAVDPPAPAPAPVPAAAEVTPPVRAAIAPPPVKLELRLDGIAPMLTLASASPAPRPEFVLAQPLNLGWSDPIAPLPAPAPAAVEPPGPPAPAAVDPAADPALEAIRARVAAHPTLNTALALALLENAQAKAANPAIAKELSLTDQKLLQDMLTALNGVSATPAAGGLTERAAPLVEAAKKWQADADLVLPKLALASRVDSYGVYTKVDPKFAAGKKQTVIIYCEVANFSPKKTADEWYETHLSQQETLATDDGLLLWRPNAEEVEDRSKNQRRDFYLVKKLTIPDNLAVGKYALRMSVTDKNTGKIAVVSLPIEIIK